MTAPVDISGWAQEGGVDAAAQLLKGFDPDSGAWAFEQRGLYWDAVSLAKENGRTGEGEVIAVIDDGFDTDLPPLRSQDLPWGTHGAGHQSHGTAVALLLLHVAPRAHLLLYPVMNSDGVWEADLIMKALADVRHSDATVINLSLGRARPVDDVIPAKEWVESLEPWPDLTAAEVPFMIGDFLSRLPTGRSMATAPASDVGAAALEVANSGRIVVAAAGNSADHIFDPALVEKVYSVGFGREVRDGEFDEFDWKQPEVAESTYIDFTVDQPPGVLGSRFATPMITGLVALMQHKDELPAYREVQKQSSLATTLLGILWANPDVGERATTLVDKLFRRAHGVVPHAHVSTGSQGCPECAFFATGAFTNYADYLMSLARHDEAEHYLRQVTQFAPRNAHGLYRLGVLWAVRADVACRTSNYRKAVSLLEQAARVLRLAGLFSLDSEPYTSLLANVEDGMRRPNAWRFPGELTVGGNKSAAP